MSIAEYKADPWKAEQTHRAYSDSAIAIRPAPEFATSEIVVSSLYRAVGFENFSERGVISTGGTFKKESDRSRSPSPGTISSDTWQTIIYGALASPRQSNQSSKRGLQLTPLVPDANLYSGSARLAGNPWNPGALLKRIIQMGCRDEVEATSLWRAIYEGLSVDSGDDAWARWLQEEFTRRKSHAISSSWSCISWDGKENDLPESDKLSLVFPAQQFVIDIRLILEAKPTMTRRQWLSLLEAVVRIGAVSHVLWLCGVSSSIWEFSQRLLRGTASTPSDLKDIQRLVFSSNTHHLAYGTTVLPAIKNIASSYLAARLGINVILWHLESLKIAEIPHLNSSADVQRLFQLIEENRDRLVNAGVIRDFEELRDDPNHARTLACKKGIGSNLVEFARYVLGRRQTADSALRSYDQSYVLNKNSIARNAPWIVSLGPVALLALVHCCLRQFSGPRSVRYLSRQLLHYGISVATEDIATNELGRELRMLGLILDSPDAESGILLVPPFNVQQPEVAN